MPPGVQVPLFWNQCSKALHLAVSIHKLLVVILSHLQVRLNLDPVDQAELWAVANHALAPAVTLWVCITKKLLVITVHTVDY